jgi:hypothetical protein
LHTKLHSLGIGAMVLGGVVGLAACPSMTTAVQMSAKTALIMGGTEHPLVNPNGRDASGDYWLVDPVYSGQYVSDAGSLYVEPAGGAGEQYRMVATYTPEEFFPVFGKTSFDASVATGVAGLDSCLEGTGCVSRTMPGGPDETSGFVVFGYSQSARVATVEKRDLIERYGADNPNAVGPEDAPDVAFVLIGNPNRPNGGVMQRFSGLYIPILGVTFDGATPTDSDLDGDGDHEFETVDIARQYDGWADFPLTPLNGLATVNAVAGIYYLHGDYMAAGPAYEQGTHGDTTYYIIPADRLPILMPLDQVGVPSPLVTALDQPLRVVVEWGYDRDPDSVGTPKGAQLIPLKNPVTGAVDLAIAIPTGWDDAVAEVTGSEDFRPFGTRPVESPFGVGGEAVGAPLNDGGLTASAVHTQADENRSSGTAQSAAAAVAAGDSAAEPAQKPAETRHRTLLPKIRGPIQFDGPKRPPVSLRPAGDRPLERLLDRLTGQRPAPAAGAAAAGSDAGAAAGSDADANT